MRCRGNNLQRRAGASHAADTLLERGAYLMNGIVACGNCHNMRGPDGRFIEGGELAGGFVIAETMFTARVPNITPDMATGIGPGATPRLSPPSAMESAPTAR
ncbi:MAG: hypothetical protein QF767_17225 [Alphaproteobacteria bacterium]|nr:hypothetical protein [Alphaproteobacteria bacterium]